MDRQPGRLDGAFTGPIHPRDIERLLCDCDISRIVTGPDSLPLDVGRIRRNPTPAMRARWLSATAVAAGRVATGPPVSATPTTSSPGSHGGETKLTNLVLSNLQTPRNERGSSVARRCRWRGRRRWRCRRSSASKLDCDPARDRGPVAGPAHAAAEPTAAEEVVDLAVAPPLLELGERRRGVAAVEAADRHDRLARRELVARGVVGADRGRDPAVAVGSPARAASRARRSPACR